MWDVESSVGSTSPTRPETKKNCLTATRTILGVIVSFLFVIVVCSITYAIVLPQMPRFAVDDISFSSSLNVSQIDSCSNVTVTLKSTNPNGLLGVYYGKLGFYFTLEDVLMAETVIFHGALQHPGNSTIWTVKGDINPILTDNIQMNRSITGLVRVNGRIQWKVRSVMSMKFGFHVKCPVKLMINGCSSHHVAQRCSVHR